MPAGRRFLAGLGEVGLIGPEVFVTDKMPEKNTSFTSSYAIVKESRTFRAILKEKTASRGRSVSTSEISCYVRVIFPSCISYVLAIL